MKASIVTVYDSMNCGSFYQAFVLKEVLEKLGCEVTFYKRDKRAAISIRRKRYRFFLKSLISGKVQRSFRYLKSIRSFRKHQNRFPIIDSSENIDCFVLGSDTIWDMESRYFKEYSSTYWGIDFFPKKVISYAASAANTDITQITPELHEAVGKMYAVSVRDRHTYELVCNDSENVQIVCDPTLLFTKQDYRQYIKKNTETKGFVFLYLNEPLTSSQSRDLKEFCKNNNLSIVNGLSFETEYCDKNVLVEPYTFLSYFYYADFVITDTFHGTVFSVNFNKRFVSLNREKMKIKDFLDSIGLEMKLVSDAGMIDTMTNPVDYERINIQLDESRRDSLSFLKNCLFGVENASIK